MNKGIRLVGRGVLGLVEGGVISIMPLPINLGIILLFLIIWPITLARAKSPVEAKGQLVMIAVGILTVIGAILLPVKQLDGRVGPMHYEKISLQDLSRRLSDDWGIRIMMYDPDAANTTVTFKTDKKMSRRRVLEKLAEETNRDLRIGYCGTGATFLFGAYPSFTTLKPKKAQPEVGGNGPLSPQP